MKIEYCADIIALYNEQQIVVIERFTFPFGYALPGGRRDRKENGKLETVIECAKREFKEETGLDLIIEGKLGIYDTIGRDPRGPKSSTVVYGQGTGILKNEIEKTHAFLMHLQDIDKNKEKFTFDHYQILCDYRKK